MKSNTKLIILIVFALFFYNYSYSQIISIGEVLEYEASYLGVSFARIIITTDRYENLNGKPAVKSKMKVYTYDHVPLVSIKADMETWMDRTSLFSNQFTRNLSLKKKEWEFQKIEFDYQQNIISNRKWIKNKVTSARGFQFNPGLRMCDGIAAFFNARLHAEAYKSKSVLTYLDEEPFYVKFNFAKDLQSIGVDAVDYKVKSIYCSGSANWEGQYGLKGSFEGWFSNDAAKVPLKGKIDFILGKINIELVSYKRAGWTPPRG